MRFTVISDIHGNLEALQAVLADSPDLPLLVLGDIIGYGADPVACLDLIRTQAAAVVMGNHEQVQLDWGILQYFSPLAAQSARYTRTQLSREDFDWIRQLQTEQVFKGLHLSHGSPASPGQFHYLQAGDVRSPYVSLSFAKLERSGLRAAFVGHTHVPGIFASHTGVRYRPMALDGSYPLPADGQAIVNCGSVGQPRNGNNRAQYVIADTQAWVVEKRSVEYDVAKAAARIREAGLPEELWRRLIQGI